VGGDEDDGAGLLLGIVQVEEFGDAAAQGVDDVFVIWVAQQRQRPYIPRKSAYLCPSYLHEGVSTSAVRQRNDRSDGHLGGAGHVRSRECPGCDSNDGACRCPNFHINGSGKI
jgi:hypothetical protein